MNSSSNDCDRCGAPARVLWGPLGHPEFSSRDTGNWISLARCDRCGTLWCASPYEPHAAFDYAARWVHTPADWRLIHDIDDGATLRDWLTGFIHDNWRNLPLDDVAAIEQHDHRASGHSPIRGLYRRSIDLEAVLATQRGT